MDPSWPASASSWLYSDPKGVRILLNQLRERYNPSEFIITENGWSDVGELDDQGRITYLKVSQIYRILDLV